jgi:hypothetical protein
VGALIDLTDVADGVLANAIMAVAGTAVATMAATDAEALIRDGLPESRLELPGMSDGEAAELETAVRSYEVRGALRALNFVEFADEESAGKAELRDRSG